MVELSEHVATLGAAPAQLQAAADRPDGQSHGRGHGRGGSPQEGSDPPRPWCWPRMTHGQKADRLAELADWVRDVLFAWPATQWAIPRCWSRHWDVVEELSALYCAWCTAYLWEERTASTSTGGCPALLSASPYGCARAPKATSPTAAVTTTPSWSTGASPSCGGCEHHQADNEHAADVNTSPALRGHHLDRRVPF